MKYLIFDNSARYTSALEKLFLIAAILPSVPSQFRFIGLMLLHVYINDMAYRYSKILEYNACKDSCYFNIGRSILHASILSVFMNDFILGIIVTALYTSRFAAYSLMKPHTYISCITLASVNAVTWYRYIYNPEMTSCLNRSYIWKDFGHDYLVVWCYRVVTIILIEVYMRMVFVNNSTLSDQTELIEEDINETN